MTHFHAYRPQLLFSSVSMKARSYTVRFTLYSSKFSVTSSWLRISCALKSSQTRSKKFSPKNKKDLGIACHILSLCKHFITLIAVPGLHPHLEYATPVLDPHQQWLINSVERVQKFALKVCTKSWSSGYGSMLQSCNLPTLASTRHYLHETMPTLSNCQCLSKFPYTVPIVATTKHVQISATTIALERPVTCHHCHFSHIKLPCGRAYLHMYNLPVIHSLKQTVICHTFNTPPYT